MAGRQSTLPLLLALLATGAAALLMRSGSWRLGRLQSQLNGALQRTVGDGLHWLKAVRAATAEAWLLCRFGDNTTSFRQLLRENVRRQQQPRAELETWLKRLGLAHLLRRQHSLEAPLPLAIDPFSGGELHRLGLLRAWLRNRPVEVLDEPTAFLDAESAERVRTILSERSRDRLVLISTHDPALIAQADQLVHLEVPSICPARRWDGGWRSGPSAPEPGISEFKAVERQLLLMPT